MKRRAISFLKPLGWLGLFGLMMVTACSDEEELPIADDLRVLKVEVNGIRLDEGATGISVISDVVLTFSNGLNASSFESAFTVSPAVNLDFSYDETNSIVTLSPNPRLAFGTDYTFNLPIGSYGANEEATIEAFTYNLSTSAFVAPSITMTSDVNSIFEGEVATVSVSISEIIFDDVTFDLVFGGSTTAEDFTSSVSAITIPAGETTASFTVTAVEGDAVEGEETIEIGIGNVVNASNDPPVTLTINVGDKAPALELKGVMELDNYIDGAGGRVRAIQLNVLKDIPDLSIFHIQIASNGAAPDPTDIDFVFPAQAATAGDKLFVVRDADAALAATYFGSGYAQFTEFQTGGMTHNGDDAILLYENGTSIESFGEPGVDGTDMFWEYTDSWAYKIGTEWYYAGVGCVTNAAGEATDATSSCTYPEFSPGLEFKGIMDLNHANGNLRAYHLIAFQDISDISVFGFGIASNGQATSDGVEVSFPAMSVSAGEHILVIRDLDVDNAAAYFEGCYSKFDHVLPVDGLTSNGDDTIELFKDNSLIETYGELGVDGTGAFWEYDNSWAYKVAGAWTYGGVGCSTDATTNATSSCSYTFCD
jgi:hypothetical protein